MMSTRDAEIEVIGTARAILAYLSCPSIDPEIRLRLVHEELMRALKTLDQAREQALTWPKLPEYRREEGGQDDK